MRGSPRKFDAQGSQIVQSGAITRETIIRGLGGTITYTPRNVTVTLDRPGQPRIARAPALLLAGINTRPPILPGDGRPITYALRQSQ